MKKNILLSCFFFNLAGILNAQPTGILTIPLPKEMSHSNNEYNGMILRGDKMLSISQFPERKIYALDTMQIHNFIAGRTKTISLNDRDMYSVYCVNNIISQLNSYEGFESAVTVGNSLFFTIETEDQNDTCYVFKGSLDNAKSKKLILDASVRLALAKTEKVSNAGFEAMSYLPGSKKLIAFFEYNKIKDHQPYALVFDTTLIRTPDTLFFEKPLPMRLTDVFAINDSTLAGINYNYYDEKEYHEPGETVKMQDGKFIALEQNDYSRLIKLHIKNKRITIVPFKDIEYKKKDANPGARNYETIIPFYKGFLIL